jgi:cytochrome P450
MNGRTLPDGLEWHPATRQLWIRTQDLADIALRDPHIDLAPDSDRDRADLPDEDAVPTVAQFFELWYHRGANHPVFRHHLRKAYSAGSSSRYHDTFADLAARRLAQLPPAGDLVSSFIAPYCLDSTFRSMGFPEREWGRLAKVYRVVMFVIKLRFRAVLRLEPRQRLAFEAALRHLRSSVEELLRADRPSPLVTAFQEYASAHDRHVWADVATIGQLLAAGVPQVTTGLAVACRSALADPALLGRIRTGEVGADEVAEEAMRLTPPFLGVFGWVNESCDCLGLRLEPGSAVVVDIPAVNTDPARVEDPREFCPHRSRHANFTFGKGAHYCLGATSARAQIAPALRSIVDHPRRVDIEFDAVRLDNDGFSQTVRAFPYRLGG